MRKDIYNQIINMLPSADLRQKIAELDSTVPEFDLLRIVYLHAASFDDQVKYFRLLQKECESEEVRMHAKLILEHTEKSLAEFERGGPNIVYELRIKTEPDSYEEKYLCATLSHALSAIPRFYELYESAKETDKTRYSIVKRRIFDGSEPFDEDYLGDGEYLAGGRLYRVSQNETVACYDDVPCEKCGKACLVRVKKSPSLPKYIEDGDVVRFFDHNGKQMFGCNIDLAMYNSEYTPYTPDYFIIPLYEDGGDYDSWELFNMHHHADAGLIDRAELSELSEKQREEVEKIRTFVRENLGNNGK